jgi:DnaK suppressor protein
VTVDTDRARRLLREERERLEAILERHRSELGRSPASESGDLTEVDQHQADEATEMYDREDIEGRIGRVEAELAAIARAERRLEDGTYGVSVESGAAIPDERLEAVPYAERTADEEERFRREAGAPVPTDDDDDSTPLDEPAEPPHDLAEIPMSRDHEPTVDPQEEDDEVRLPMSGEAYPGEGGAPDVGRPAADDPAVDRRYRPER